ncbi:MAG: hypothetical protein RLZZ437_2074 [Pseudomonadota bacterium]
MEPVLPTFPITEPRPCLKARGPEPVSALTCDFPQKTTGRQAVEVALAGCAGRARFRLGKGRRNVRPTRQAIKQQRWRAAGQIGNLGPRLVLPQLQLFQMKKGGKAGLLRPGDPGGKLAFRRPFPPKGTRTALGKGLEQSPGTRPPRHLSGMTGGKNGSLHFARLWRAKKPPGEKDDCGLGHGMKVSCLHYEMRKVLDSTRIGTELCAGQAGISACVFGRGHVTHLRPFQKPRQTLGR